MLSPFAMRLPLHAAACVALHECLDLGHGHPIEVTEDRVLEARGRRRELERPGVVAIGEHSMDQTGSEGIAGADPVYDVGDLIPPAAQETGARRDHRRPAVVIGAVTL